MELPFDLAPDQGMYLAAALVVAAFIRGLSGFGFSAIIILLASLVTNPLPLIPVIFACEIGMTAFQARGILPHVQWGKVLALLLGSAIAVFPSVALLARLDPDQVRIIIALLILVLSLLLLSGFSFGRVVGKQGNFLTGIGAGMANSAGVGGLVAAAFFSAQPIEAAIFRATMIVFLTGLDIMTLPVMGAHGLIGPDSVTAFLIAFPLLGLGVWLGSVGFSRISQSNFRRLVIFLLTALSIINVAKVIL